MVAVRKVLFNGFTVSVWKKRKDLCVEPAIEVILTQKDECT